MAQHSQARLRSAHEALISDVATPKPKPKLIVVAAFDKDDDGELQTVFGPTEQQSEERAVRTAKALAVIHTGAIAWSQSADFSLGDYGPPTILFVHGEVPDME